MSLMLTCTAEKRSTPGHDWSTETEVAEIFDRCGLDMTRVQPLNETFQMVELAARM